MRKVVLDIHGENAVPYPSSSWFLFFAICSRSQNSFCPLGWYFSTSSCFHSSVNENWKDDPLRFHSPLLKTGVLYCSCSFPWISVKRSHSSNGVHFCRHRANRRWKQIVGQLLPGRSATLQFFSLNVCILVYVSVSKYVHACGGRRSTSGIVFPLSIVLFETRSHQLG